MRISTVLAGCVVVVLGGCGDLFGTSDSAGPEPGPEPEPGVDPEPVNTPPLPRGGERQRAYCSYVCVGERDPACLSAEPLPFPTGIAIGSTFELSCEAHDDFHGLTVRSGATTRIAESYAGFVPQAPGSTAMLVFDAVEGEGEVVVDYLGVFAAAPVAVIVRRGEQAVQAVTLELDNEAALVALTVDAVGDDLVGTLDFEWAVDDETVAQFLTTSAGGARVRAVGPGTAVVTATRGELTAAVEVTVIGDAVTTGVATDDTGGGTTDEGTTSGTDTTGGLT